MHACEGVKLLRTIQKVSVLQQDGPLINWSNMGSLQQQVSAAVLYAKLAEIATYTLLVSTDQPQSVAFWCSSCCICTATSKVLGETKHT
jgi:hypothetical protein